MELDLQGNIEKFTLAEIFQLIAAGRKSGTLGIQREDSIVMIYFDRGEIIYGYGPRQTFHLGQLLKERGKLDSRQLEDAVQTQARTDNTKRLGEILIEKRFIDRADLQAVVQEQVSELLYSLLSWQTGSFKFYENQFPTDEEITVRLSVENVILEGLRRLDEQNWIAETLPDLTIVYTLSAAQGGRNRAVTLEANEWNTMALIDGHRTLIDVCVSSQITRDECLRILAKLKLAGIITPTERKTTPVVESSVTPTAGSTGELESAVANLSRLFEDYLTAKTTTFRPVVRTITTSVLGEKQ
jgi:hypothetical protein